MPTPERCLYATIFAALAWVLPVAAGETPATQRDGAAAAVKNRSEPAAIPAEQFEVLYDLIKPQPGELRFREIPWLLSVWEARKQAAAQGKPILVWSGSGGAPIGVC